MKLIKKFKPKVFVELNEIALKENGDTVENILNFMLKHQYKVTLEENIEIKSYEQLLEISNKNPEGHTNAYFS